MNVMAGVKVLQGGGEAPFVEFRIGSVSENLSPTKARQLAARLYLAARAAERITEKGRE